MTERVAIIGAGVAGMAAAIHARESGFQVDLFERHSVPGGLCTSWRIDGFLFDGCVEFFMGSGASSPFHALWREVGVVPRAFVDRQVYSETLFPDGRRVLLHADPDRLEKHFDEISPEDRETTRHLVELVRLMRRARYRVDRAAELLSFVERTRAFLDLLPTLRLWRDGFATSIRDFGAKFQSPALRAAITHAIPADLPLLYLVQILADLANGAAGSPIGGSLQIALSMAKRCRERGVRMHLGTEVDEIEVDGGVAIGLRLANGQPVAADAVVAASDLRLTLDRLLRGRFPSPPHEALFSRPLVASVCLVSCGLRAPLGTGVDAVIHRRVVDPPIEIAGHRLEVLAWKSFLHDPSLAASPRTIVTVTIDSDWELWNALASDRRRYDAARAELGAGIVRAMDAALPGFAAAVETVDVATPVTIEHYTANHHGHYMTFMPTLGRPPSPVPRTVPGVSRLYLAGMWVEPPGGLPNALRSGRDVVQVMCRDHRVPFRGAGQSTAEV
jgi:phytoene desaturase